MIALQMIWKHYPPDKESFDKYYLGYYDGEKLIAVMDLILHYPDKDTAFIGFFMTDVSVQNAGIGSVIIDMLCSCLKNYGFSSIRLGWVKGNPQVEHFWKKEPVCRNWRHLWYRWLYCGSSTTYHISSSLSWWFPIVSITCCN